jgi:hypothetical protein
MKSVDTQRLGLVKSRSGVTKPGKYFTSAETIRNIVKDRERKQRLRQGASMLAEARAADRASIANKARFKSAVAKKRELGLPATCPIKEDKDGNLFCQPRINGKFGKRVIVG